MVQDCLDRQSHHRELRTGMDRFHSRSMQLDHQQKPIWPPGPIAHRLLPHLKQGSALVNELPTEKIFITPHTTGSLRYGLNKTKTNNSKTAKIRSYYRHTHKKEMLGKRLRNSRSTDYVMSWKRGENNLITIGTRFVLLRLRLGDRDIQFQVALSICWLHNLSVVMVRSDNVWKRT